MHVQCASKHSLILKHMAHVYVGQVIGIGDHTHAFVGHI